MSHWPKRGTGTSGCQTKSLLAAYQPQRPGSASEFDPNPVFIESFVLMTSESSTISASGMTAETGYDLAEDVAPLRISGFISLLLGLASVLSVIAVPLLVIPVLAIAFGLVALRNFDGPTPVGVRAAKIGLVLAAGFGASGFFLPWMKTMTLGKQAEYFAKQYVEVVARGDMELAMELRKNYLNRFLQTMSLKRHYALNEDAARALEDFRGSSVNAIIQQLGPGANWELDRAVRVFQSYRLDRAELILVNNDRDAPVRIYLLLIYQPHRETGVGQWHVEECVEYGERIVAPAVL